MRIPSVAYPAAPHHASIVVAAPCAGQQGACIQQPEDVFLQVLVHKDVGRHKARPLQLLVEMSTQQPANVYLQTLMYKDVGRHKARPLQLMWIYGLSVVRVSDDCAVGGHCCVGTGTAPLLCPTI